MTRGMYFSILLTICVLVYLLWIQGMEFRKRAKEIIRFYNRLEKYLIRDSKWSEVMEYPSSFYDVKFQTSEEVIGIMTIMIRDAIKCFKQQNAFTRAITENLLDELNFIQRKLMTIYVLG